MNDLKARLTQDHQEIDALLRRLSEDAAAPESAPLHSTWCQFETRLLCHMDAEERHLLPLIEVSDPGEAAHTRLEHVRIRQMVYELGVAIELHSARQPAIDALVQLLHEHARREDLVLYELVGEQASSAIQSGIADMLRAGLQRALHATTAEPATTAARTSAEERARP